MSSALAIAAATAILKYRIENGLIDHKITTSLGSDVTVSALPPDRIAIGTEEKPQINLFLWQVTPNTGLRRSALSSSGAAASRPPSLSLDLHYMISAYGAQDFHGELLLGYVIQLFNESPALKRDTLRDVLGALMSTEGGRTPAPALTAFGASGMAESLEQMTIHPQFLSLEELSKVWSALQAHFRPSASYKVSLLIE